MLREGPVCFFPGELTAASAAGPALRLPEPIRIIQIENACLSAGAHRATIGRMIGVSVDLDRSPLSRFDQGPTGLMASGTGGRIGIGDPRNLPLGLARVGHDFSLVPVVRAPCHGKGARGGEQCEEAFARYRRHRCKIEVVGHAGSKLTCRDVIQGSWIVGLPEAAPVAIHSLCAHRKVLNGAWVLVA
jgi:hypothetical protein